MKMRWHVPFIALAIFASACKNSQNQAVSSTKASTGAPAVSAASPAQIGPSWHWVSPQPQGNALFAVVANLQCGVVAVGEESTVMRSADDGLTWTTHQSPERWRFKSAALAGTDLYVVGDSTSGAAIVKIPSCGEGVSKTLRKLDVKTEGNANAVVSDPSGRIFVTTVLHARGKILCSSDHGSTFTTCDDQEKMPFYGLFSDETERIFVAGGYDTSGGGLVRSSADHGKTWTTLKDHLGQIAYGIFGDSKGQRLLVTGSGSLSSSNDGGATWKSSDVGMMSGGSMMLGAGDAPYVPNDFDMFIYGNAASGTYFLAGGGVIRGTQFDPKPKLAASAKDEILRFEAAVATAPDHWVAVGDEGLLARSTDDGRSWVTLSKNALQDGDQFVDVRSDGATTYSLRRAGFFRSDDAGATFSRIGKETLPDITVSTRDYPSFAVDHAAVALPRPSKNAVATSVDRGVTFREIPLSLAAGQNVLHVWNGNAGTFFATGNGGALFRSRDEGATFTPLQIATKEPLAAGVVQDHDVFTVGVGATSGSGHTFHSGDDGDTWTSTAIDFDPFGIGVSGKQVYVVGRYGQVARSYDEGHSWTKTIDLDCGDVGGMVVQHARIDVACGSGRLYTSVDDATTFTMKPLPAQTELLFPDAHGGLFAAGDRFPQLLHFN